MTAPTLSPAPTRTEDETTARGHLARTESARRRRSLTVSLSLMVASFLVAAASLSIGDFQLSAGEIVRTLIGQGDRLSVLVITEFRGPRLVLGALVGVALGLSGALFQSVLRNPLASPDIIGISQGASVGAVSVLLVAGLTGGWVTLGALAGAGVVAGINLLMTWRGGLDGQRFVLAGIGLAFAAASVLGYLLTRADVQDAQAALVWMSGSVASATWEGITLLAISLAVLVPPTLMLAARLRMLGLGEDTAEALGVPVLRTRVAAVLLGIGLAAVGTAAAGPVAFVALASAPIARRLIGDGRANLVPSAVVGLTLVTASDVVAQHAIPGQQMPVGLITGVVGGIYLIWLLASARPRIGGS